MDGGGQFEVGMSPIVRMYSSRPMLRRACQSTPFSWAASRQRCCRRLIPRRGLGRTRRFACLWGPTCKGRGVALAASSSCWMSSRHSCTQSPSYSLVVDIVLSAFHISTAQPGQGLVGRGTWLAHGWVGRYGPVGACRPGGARGATYWDRSSKVEQWADRADGHRALAQGEIP